ncbi:MAG: aminoacyl-tRNA hydrolase [Anaerolineaceae bacterium]|nr:aminoacyl-tRNA hydrolase [Anaerolineaceae bacterium]
MENETIIPPPPLPEQEKVWEGPFLIAGLGNPGRDYRHNRHNVGFMALDELASRFKIPMSKVQARAITGIGMVEGRRVILTKPQTYMNLSGTSVSSLARYYKVETDHLLVIHDDIDLPLGTLRIRAQGSAGGQKGMVSIIERLGTNQFPRARLGVGRPPGRMPTADYVLEDFFPEEKYLLGRVFSRLVSAIDTFIYEGIEPAMTRFNGPVDKV